MGIIGLALSSIGAIMIFFFGLHPMISAKGAVYLIKEQPDEGEIRKAKKYKIVSIIGLSFLIIGFLLQLWEKIIGYG